MRALWWAAVGAVLLFLVAPVLVVVPLSFSAGTFLHFPLPGLSLRWYRAFFDSPFWMPALRNSLIVGVGATVASTVLGTLAALGLWAGRFPLRGLAMGLILSPMVVPSIVIGVALTFAFAPLGLTESYAGLILAHTVLASPFVVVTVLSALQRFDRTLLRAAAALGAGPVGAFRRVTLPLIAPGAAAGAVFAFATSLDESVVVLFLAGPAQRTLPRQMFSGLHDTIELTILAAATLLIAASAVLLGLASLLRRP